MPKPTVIEISAKCSDLFTGVLKDKDGNEVHEYIGYVPDFFPEEHYGDYVQLDIELATGKILNWKPPTAAQLKALMEKTGENADEEG